MVGEGGDYMTEKGKGGGGGGGGKEGGKGKKLPLVFPYSVFAVLEEQTEVNPARANRH